MLPHMQDRTRLEFHGGSAGALAPFLLFLAGVVWLGLSGAPDERGFWPVLVAALGVGILLARDRRAYAETLIDGMSQRIVMLMILAWMLAGVMGSLLSAAGLVDALIWAAGAAGLSGGMFCAAAFLIAAAVSTATGTSLGTLIICAPLLYPAGGGLGAHPAVLLGAILGGATFGDNISPVSDTTIASATTQQAEMGRVVRSRMRFALPAAAAALVGYALLGSSGGGPSAALPTGDPAALPMLAAPALVIFLLLRHRHLLEGLLAGIFATASLGLALGRLTPTQLLHIDTASFGARGLVVDGIDRAVGVSVFTLLLMGLVAGLEASGLPGRLVEMAGRRARTARHAELWLFAVVSLMVLLTTHPVVAILMTSGFATSLGARFGIDRYRRTNILDVTVCTYPFLLPYFIPTILAASTTHDGPTFGMPRITALQAGLWNLHSWMLLAVLLFSLLSGWGSAPGASRPPR